MSTTAPRRAGRVSSVQARARILEAAARLLASRPFRELTVEDVMAAAGLSRTIFYRHFDGLADLVLALLAAVGDEVASALTACAPGARDDQLRELLGAGVDIFARHGRFLRAIDDAARTDATIDAVYRRFVNGTIEATAALLRIDIDEGRMPPAPDAHELARALTLMNAGYLTETLGRDAGFDRSLVLETLLYVWSALANPKAGPETGRGAGPSASPPLNA